jgi:hypothetical protein
MLRNPLQEELLHWLTVKVYEECELLLTDQDAVGKPQSEPYEALGWRF